MSDEDDAPECDACKGAGVDCAECEGTGKEPAIYCTRCSGPFYGFHACPPDPDEEESEAP